MHGKKAISLIFIFLMISGGFITLSQGARAQSEQQHFLMVFDAKGRQMNPVISPEINEFLKTKVYEPKTILGIPVGWQEIAEGSSNFYFNSSGVVKIISTWMGKVVYEGNLVPNKPYVNITLNVVPAVPIQSYKVVGIHVSSDLHEFSTDAYDVKFGYGDKNNEIVIQIGGSDSYTVPVYLSATHGSSTQKPFRFLAQNPNTIVKGQEKFLIWTTAYYWSAVKTAKVGVGGGSVLVVWTYGYIDVYKEWIKAITASALAGALIGASTGVGAIGGAVGGALASSAIWAIKPELLAHKRDMAIGVVVGLFTSRYFILQASSTGTNTTTATVEMNTGNIKTGNYIISQNHGWVYSAVINSNGLQFAVIRHTNNNAIEKIYWDFEDGKVPEGWTGDTGDLAVSTDKKHDGAYSLRYSSTGKSVSYTIKTSPSDTITVSFWAWIEIGARGGVSVGDKGISLDQQTWKYYSVEVHPTSDTVKFTIWTSSSGADTIYLDDVSIEIEHGNLIKKILMSSAENPFIRLSFGTIPTISPGMSTGITIPYRNSLIMIDMPEGSALAIDWASPEPQVIPSAINLKTDTWNLNGLLLATDTMGGFQNVSFVVVPAGQFVYKVDFQTYNLFSTFTNWTVKPNWTPFIANNTTIYVPNLDAFNNPISVWQYNIHKWWQDMGTLGHLALYGLGLLIIFIILLIVAPWLIITLIKILGLILRNLFNVLGVIFKGIGKAMKHKRRR